MVTSYLSSEQRRPTTRSRNGHQSRSSHPGAHGGRLANLLEPGPMERLEHRLRTLLFHLRRPPGRGGLLHLRRETFHLSTPGGAPGDQLQPGARSDLGGPAPGHLRRAHLAVQKRPRACSWKARNAGGRPAFEHRRLQPLRQQGRLVLDACFHPPVSSSGRAHVVVSGSASFRNCTTCRANSRPTTFSSSTAKAAPISQSSGVAMW